VITSYQTTSAGPLTLVTVVSSLAGTVYYNWFLDGQFVTQTTQPQYTFAIGYDQQATVDVVDSNSPGLDDFNDDFNDDFGWDDSTVAGWPLTRTLEFVRSLDPTVAAYQVQQQVNGGAWTNLNTVADDPTRWVYQYTTAPLDDLTNYAWQVVPIGQNGNAGTPAAIGAELIVRTPDAPAFTASLNGSQHMVFAA